MAKQKELKKQGTLEKKENVKAKEANMEYMNIQLTHGDRYLPKYASDFSGGMDVKARLDGVPLKELGTEAINPGEAVYATNGCTLQDGTLVIPPRGRALVFVGIKSEFPKNYVADIRPRSGLAITKGLGIVNSPGTIDADYRHEWGVIVINHNMSPIKISDGDRIAQALIGKVHRLHFRLVSSFDSDKNRGGGFGSTGTK